MSTLAFLQAKSPVQPASSKSLHYDAVKAIAQAAINVEEFTIPLYMCSMYSLVGTHQITGKGTSFYRGRWWPGLKTNANTGQWPYSNKDKLPNDTSLFSATNNEIFNKIFKVFIEEMLHLQLASNLAKSLGVQPTFTDPALVDSDTYAWKCYSGTVIPYVVDLTDTDYAADVKVQLDDLNKNQIKLFKAIEIPDGVAMHSIKPSARRKYFPDVPFAGWSSGQALPMFGSIGHMYSCLWKYLKLPFEDGTILLDYIIQQTKSQQPQNNMFQYQEDSHSAPQLEYPGFKPTVDTTERNALLKEIADMINAITDQGEGSDVAAFLYSDLYGDVMPKTVMPKFQASLAILQKAYQAYDDEGNAFPDSGDAIARAGAANVDLDHEELFEEVEKLMQNDDFITWKTWHANGNKWTTDLLTAKDYVNNTYKDRLPQPDQIADAIVSLKADEATSYPRMYKATTGAIWGIISVLNDYWTLGTDGKPKAGFPYPSMDGSGDRMSICWAVYGMVPDITKGLDPSEKRNPHVVNHACQGLDYTGNNADPSDCAAVGIYHTCRGSNHCRAEGGCGFVQPVTGGGSCGSSLNAPAPSDTQYYSAPSDNNCGGQGGCAVPISASQLYPQPKGEMSIYDFGRKPGTCGFPPVIDGTLIGHTTYALGDNVYDKAWEVYTEVLKHRGNPVPEKPAPSIYRLAFPPST